MKSETIALAGMELAKVFFPSEMTAPCSRVTSSDAYFSMIEGIDRVLFSEGLEVNRGREKEDVGIEPDNVRREPTGNTANAVPLPSSP